MYGKIFDSMYEGTLYGHWQAIVTMQQLIVLCNADGIIDMTPQAIAARTSIPLEIIKEGLRVLSEPDNESRTPGSDGRRIELIDSHRSWGWVLINHHKYKMMVSQDEKREADRVRIRDKRKAEKDSKNRGVAECRTVSQGVAEVAHADADANADTDKARAGTARGALCKALIEKGVKITPMNPLVVDWLARGLTIEMALEGVARARLNKPEGQIPAGYLAPIIADILSPKAPVVREIQMPSQTAKGISILESMKGPR